MKVKYVVDRNGCVPECGELFSVQTGSTVYMRVMLNPSCCASVKLSDNSIMGACLETGEIYQLEICTANRNGFVLYEPDGGTINIKRLTKGIE